MANESLLYIEIITPEKTFFSGSALSVSLPGSLSPFQVLPKHAPIVSSLDAGVVKVGEVSGKELLFAIAGGFVDVKSNNVSILVEKAIAEQDIILSDAEKTLSKAKAMVAETKSEENSKLVAQLKFAEACFKIAKKK